MTRWIAVLALLLTACPAGYGGRLFASVTSYKMPPSNQWVQTPKHVRTHNATPAQRLEIDRRIDALEACLGQPIKRDWLSIYIAPDSIVSPCSGQQLLPALAPQSVCVAKGLTPDPRCPCRWRGAIQGGFYIVVTPDLRMLKEQVTRLVLNVNNPWSRPELARCL